MCASETSKDMEGGMLNDTWFTYCGGLQDDIESQARRMEAQVTAAQAAASAAQAEKASIQDTVHRLEGEKASMQRQLAEVSEQLQKEQGKANDLETKGTVASAEADVCYSCSFVPVFFLQEPLDAVMDCLQRLETLSS